jgi:tRNA-splicing ligase RtcB|tara:strand:+ start:3246 stop:4475 length:1230 start_codon:yes stop_codon:yes gene_type:complete
LEGRAGEWRQEGFMRYMFIYKKENQLPIKSWILEEDYNADEKMVEQVENLAKLPFAFQHVALLPDGHVGYGMPIGGIMATKNVIVPNAVGVDIGCGVCAVKTSLTEIDTEILKKIMGEIRKLIPLGFKRHKEGQDMDWEFAGEGEIPKICLQEWSNASKSLGTLGGGNHFIEIQKGDDGHIWIMLHSGSRNLGFTVANFYNRLAVKLNQKWHSQVPKEWELAFLLVDSEEGQKYIEEMRYCVEYALANRELMMDRILDIIREKIGGFGYTWDNMINIAHNYAALENHFGQNVWVHRKGATRAREGQLGIIPGSQGTNSYIVRGKGNPDSFESCSHGAGRKMGRKEAKCNLNLEEEIKKLKDKNVIHGIRGIRDLDEAPGAYKDINTVIQNQKDLIDVAVILYPLAVIKG